MSRQTKAANPVLRRIPSIDEILRSKTALALNKSVSMRQLSGLARTVVAEIRALVRSGSPIAGRPPEQHTALSLLEEAERRLNVALESERLTGLKRVINATGVILHTNLGRAPLSAQAIQAIQNAAHYCNLEYDIVSGSRGRRGARVESLLTDLTGAEDALVVNNCASAALLVLTALAKDGETIVSRGELVEIGGDFRIPEVLGTSGTRMVEVGTTNRTHIDDYRRAITNETRLLMRVHPSNYRIVGFASAPEFSELVELAQQSKLPLYEDAGSGVINDLDRFGVTGEFSVRKLVSSGVDVISFSGDKLLGSVQAGLIVGKAEIVKRLRKHPLYRALRCDKVRLAALQASLESYQSESEVNELPVIRMLATTPEEIGRRAREMSKKLLAANPTDLIVTLEEDYSAIGGGAGPTAELKTTVISLTHTKLSADNIERQLRAAQPPVIARISEGRVLIDLRTVAEEEEPALLKTLQSLKIAGSTRLGTV